MQIDLDLDNQNSMQIQGQATNHLSRAWIELHARGIFEIEPPSSSQQQANNTDHLSTSDHLDLDVKLLPQDLISLPDLMISSALQCNPDRKVLLPLEEKKVWPD